MAIVRRLREILFVVGVLMIAVPGFAGSIFLTGHDPDFHAFAGGNLGGAEHINQVAIAFIGDPSSNPFRDAGVTKFLFVEAKGSAPGGHVNGVNGITASGFIPGTDFDHHDAGTLDAALDALGTTYYAIVVASDFGGILKQAELDILNARSADIIAFLNAGGGLYAMAESNGGAGLTPNGGHFGFLPFIVTSTQLDQTEVGNTLTPFGTSLGLLTSDINGNASHNIFNGTFGLSVVDRDANGNILTIAGRGLIGPGGIQNNPTAPALSPIALLLLVSGVVAAGVRSITRRR